MSSRRLVALGILGAWIGGIAVFASRETGRSPAERIASVAMRVAPGATWLSVEREGRQVGFSSITVDTMPRELQVTEYLVADISGTGRAARRSEQTVARLSRGLALRTFERSTVTGTDSVRLRGQVANDSLIMFATTRGETIDSGSARHRGLTFVRPLVPIITALRQQPRVGSRVDVDVFDIDRRQVRALEVHVTAESTFVVPDSAAFDPTAGRWLAAHQDSVQGWRLTTIGDGAEVWVDRLGQVVAASTPDGLTLRRVAFEMAFENWRLANPVVSAVARAGGDVVSSTMLRAGVLDDHVPLEALRFRVHAGSSGALAFGQEYRNGNLITTRRPAADALIAAYALPLDEHERRARVNTLRREPLVEVDHPRIVTLALRLRGRDRDPATVARALLSWVHDSVARDTVSAPRSAVQVLAQRRGDCGELARLFVALARAAGIPTRGAAGLVYAGGKFYYHAWAEVLLGRRFVAVDPMLGQIPADASHLRWMSGSLDLQDELMRVMARLELQIVGTTALPDTLLANGKS